MLKIVSCRTKNQSVLHWAGAPYRGTHLDERPVRTTPTRRTAGTVRVCRKIVNLIDTGLERLYPYDVAKELMSLLTAVPLIASGLARSIIPMQLLIRNHPLVLSL